MGEIKLSDFLLTTPCEIYNYAKSGYQPVWWCPQCKIGCPDQKCEREKLRDQMND